MNWDLTTLSQLSVKDRLQACPLFLIKLFSQLIRDLDIYSIWIFGSRAKGSHRPLSDIDIAVKFNPSHQTHWHRFKSNLDELEDTLLDIDWVDFNHAPLELQKEIQKTGVLIYEKTTT